MNWCSQLVEIQKKNAKADLEDSLAFSYNFKHSLTIWSTTMFLKCHLNESETLVHTKSTGRYLWQFFFKIITPNWRHPRYLWKSKWISKLWYIHIIRYYSVITRNELSSHKKPWRNLKYTLLSGSGPSSEASHYVIPLSDILEKAKL